ncbi:MAG: hypothetical protein AMXMBFR56_66060 [Polyangiaceae bacterium]
MSTPGNSKACAHCGGEFSRPKKLSATQWAEWARRMGLSAKGLSRRIRRFGVERALSYPKVEARRRQPLASRTEPDGRRPWQQRHPRTKNCGYCAKPFTPPDNHRERAKFCSQSCATKHYWDTRRAQESAA